MKRARIEETRLNSVQVSAVPTMNAPWRLAKEFGRATRVLRAANLNGD